MQNPWVPACRSSALRARIVAPDRLRKQAGLPRGATLLELLVVLVLMAIASSLVFPAFRNPVALPTADDSSDDIEASGQKSHYGDAVGAVAVMRTPDVDVIITTARRHALARGEPVRLRAASDGVWAIVSANSGAAIATGRLESPPSWPADLTVDAMGSCALSVQVAPLAGATAWDALRCRWRGTAP